MAKKSPLLKMVMIGQQNLENVSNKTMLNSYLMHLKTSNLKGIYMKHQENSM